MMYAAHALRAVEEFGGSDGVAISRRSPVPTERRSNSGFPQTTDDRMSTVWGRVVGRNCGSLMGLMWWPI